MQQRYATPILYAMVALATSCPGNDSYVNAAIQQMGETVRGPSTVYLTRLNALRYNIAISRIATYPAGPGLTGNNWRTTVPEGTCRVNPLHLNSSSGVQIQ